MWAKDASEWCTALRSSFLTTVHSDVAVSTLRTQLGQRSPKQSAGAGVVMVVVVGLYLSLKATPCCACCEDMLPALLPSHRSSGFRELGHGWGSRLVIFYLGQGILLPSLFLMGIGGVCSCGCLNPALFFSIQCPESTFLSFFLFLRKWFCYSSSNWRGTEWFSCIIAFGILILKKRSWKGGSFKLSRFQWCWLAASRSDRNVSV